MKYDVFISYSRDDKSIVHPFTEYISKATSRNCWLDLKGIENSEEFEEVIMRAINGCQVVLFMLSDNSLKSKWTKREVYYAEGEGKRIVPVLVDGDKFRGWFKFHFGNVDFVKINSEEQKEKLMANLRTWLGVEKKEGNIKENTMSSQTTIGIGRIENSSSNKKTVWKHITEKWHTTSSIIKWGAVINIPIFICYAIYAYMSRITD